jgi:hypothetical protein
VIENEWLAAFSEWQNVSKVLICRHLGFSRRPQRTVETVGADDEKLVAGFALLGFVGPFRRKIAQGQDVNATKYPACT